MNRNPLLPQYETSRALAAINLSKLIVLADLGSVYSKQLASLAILQDQLQSLTAPLIQFQTDYAKLFAQLDLSRLVLADQVLNRLGAQTFVFNHHLLRDVTFPAAELAGQMLRTVAPTAQLMANLRLQVDAMTKLVDQSLWRTLEPLRELAERVGMSQAVCDAFLAYGLWLAPSMPEDLVQKIVTLHRQGAGSGVVHSIVSRYYAKANWKLLDGIVDACHNNPRIARRAESIRQALQAHREGLYDVAVPALLMHIEGIAADYVKANNLLPRIGPKTREIIVTALQDTPCSLLDVRTYAGVTALLAYIENSMYIFVDFDKQHRRLLREKRLVAHAIRHGRQVSYGSRINALRLFLMIDALSLLK